MITVLESISQCSKTYVVDVVVYLFPIQNVYVNTYVCK